MNFLERILYALSAQMERPYGYGAFHLACLAAVAVLTIAVCVIFRNASQKTERILLLSVWGLLATLEIYKQLVFAVNFEENDVFWRYRWDSFPFQFCSSPLYMLPLAVLPKSERFRDVARVFLASFSLFAGLAVLFYPDDVFSTYIGISFQTMIHHGAMIIIGVFLGGRLVNEGKMTIRRFLKASGMFASLVLTALVFNLCAPMVTDMTFNMFFIGPNFPCQLVILNVIYITVPYPVFLLIYTLGFICVAFAVFSLQLILRPAWYRSLRERERKI